MEWIEQPEIVGVISGLSTTQATIYNRPSHTFIYKLEGESMYFFQEKQIRFTKDTILFIPEKESYSFRKISEGDSPYRLINFHIKTEKALSPKLFTLHNAENISLLFRKMERNWRLSGKGDFAKIYENLSLFYALLAMLTEQEQAKYVTLQQKKKIDAAIEFLEKHIFDCDLKVSQLYRSCDISAPTLTKIFLSRFGISPKKYIIQRRLLQAKVILENGEYENIAEVARSVGYDDALYFSKLFKRFYGTPPSQY